MPVVRPTDPEDPRVQNHPANSALHDTLGSLSYLGTGNPSQYFPPQHPLPPSLHHPRLHQSPNLSPTPPSPPTHLPPSHTVPSARSRPGPSSLAQYDQMNSRNQNLPSLSTLQISPQTPQHLPSLPTSTPRPHTRSQSHNTTLSPAHPTTNFTNPPPPIPHQCTRSRGFQPNLFSRRSSTRIQQELDRHAALPPTKVAARTNDIVNSYAFEGHNFFTHPTGSRDKLRIWTHNLDSLSIAQPNSLIDDIILIAQAQVDIIIWQDPLISDDTRRTILPLIKTHWGGENMEDKLWTGPQSMQKEIRHGLFWYLVLLISI